MPSTPVMELRNVSKQYESPGAAAPLNVLESVNLKLEAGESLAIIGPSGSGKSTLLQLMGTLDRPTRGLVLLDGRNLAELDELQLATIRNRQIGFVFQAHYLLPQCTVFENVLVPTLAGNGPGPVDASGRRPSAADGPGAGCSGSPAETPEERASRLLKRVGLERRFPHNPGQLSGGERQRVAVVRALINRPRLLLADEPTGSLDQASARELVQLLMDLNREEGVTLVMVTHAPDLAARMRRVLELRAARLGPAQHPNA